MEGRRPGAHTPFRVVLAAALGGAQLENVLVRINTVAFADDWVVTDGIDALRDHRDRRSLGAAATARVLPRTAADIVP